MPRTRKPKLSRSAILAGAVELADRIGVPDLTIRRLAEHLGTKPMSLYYHVRNKDDLLDGIVDAVFGEITPPPLDRPWREAIRIRCVSAHAALIRHPWAVGMLDARSNPGPATLTHHEAVLNCFRSAGFSISMTAHAGAFIDSYTYGFALQEVSLPFQGEAGLVDVAEQVTAGLAPNQFPRMIEFTAMHVRKPGYRFADEFEWGLDLMLDALQRALQVSQT